MVEDEYIDYASVRDALIETQKRRGFLTYEQKMALQHAEWSASDLRNGYKTESKVFQEMYGMFLEMDGLSKFPELAAKLSELNWATPLADVEASSPATVIVSVAEPEVVIPEPPAIVKVLPVLIVWLEPPSPAAVNDPAVPVKVIVSEEAFVVIATVPAPANVKESIAESATTSSCPDTDIVLNTLEASDP